MEITYFGWSGLAVRCGGTVVGFDLFGDAVTWDALGAADTTILCLTHGHPEHVGSMRRFLAAPEVEKRLSSIHLVSSSQLIAFANRDNVLPASNLHVIEPGETVSIAAVDVAAFKWTHGSLLPRGTWPKIGYVKRLVSHPLAAIRIGLSGLRVPRNAPMLGFHLTFVDGTTLLNYSEGMHRQADAQDVQAVARQSPADTVVFAVEPEETDVIPRWIETMSPATVLLYEAHRPWRDIFGMPTIDLGAYAGCLSERLSPTRVRALTTPGQTVVVSRSEGSSATPRRSDRSLD
jgi:hypothetical protein